MNPSLVSQRPSSSASLRPPSSASQRPPSSLSHQPTSTRPSSSLSIRSGSRVSQRPTSRHARPSTRQSSRMLPLSQTLVTQVSGLTAETDESNFRTAVEFVSKNLEYTSKVAAGVDMSVVDKQIRGHIQKARINSRDALGEALEVSYGQLKALAGQQNDLDDEIKMARLPDYLHLLISLSLPPAPSTITYAENLLENSRNPPKPPPTLTWKDILAEEPFEGQHWEGAYGLPPGSTVENWDAHSSGSTPSLSSLDDSDGSNDSLSSLDSDEVPEVLVTPEMSRQPTETPLEDRLRYNHRKEFEDLKMRQYWRAEWRIDVSLTRPFDLGDASTLGPSVLRVLGERNTLAIDGPEQERYINEHDAIREVLFALQGRTNLLLTWSHDSFTLSPIAPRLVHLTLTSFASILTSFAQTATSVERLRKFVATIFTKALQSPNKLDRSSRPKNSRHWNICTLEAFSDAVDQEIRTFDKWCATKEEMICRALGGAGPPLVVSLLSLEKSLRDTFSGAFCVLLDVLQRVLSHTSRTQQAATEVWILSDLPTRIPPASITAHLLDTLLEAVQEHLSMGDIVTSDALMRTFVKTAEPVWRMVGRWMNNGMPVRDPSDRQESYGDASLDDEFFIEDNELMLLDPDFWTEGYTLRDGMEEHIGPKTIPVFLAHVAEHVLACGKAIGLLRALGVPLVDDGAADHTWLSDWRPFNKLLASEVEARQSVVSCGSSYSLSGDTLSRLVFDELLPHCQSAGVLLVKVLVVDCDLWQHLSVMEDLFLMRKGDAMSHFADILFGKMDSGQSWSDFHFLNTAFSDAVEAGKKKWVETSLVRLSYRGGKDNAITRTLKAIDGLLIEYAVPFPLTYVFGPKVHQVYGSIFVFLLQIRRAKSLLERILVKGAMASIPHLRNELKVFYAMRSKLSWFVNTLLNSLTTYVIHAQVLKFHDLLQEAKSLDDMILLHEDHLEKIQGRCLLRPHTGALHSAILSILDICLHFSDLFLTFAGDTAHDISRQCVTMKRHRSRRQRRQSRNVIGFSQSVRESQDSSDDSDLDQGDDSLRDVEETFSMATSSAEDGFFGQVDKMSTELDGLVRFVRRGVESLSGRSGDAAAAFDVLAFALEDWDL